MSQNLKLTIELVPKTSWFTNLRSIVSKEQWDKIRNKVYWKAGYKCEICGGKGRKWPVECHEIWQYDDDNHVQTLVGLIALCPACHKVKHAGLAKIQGDEELVIEQLMKVNEMTREEAMTYIEEAFEVWRQRGVFKWEVDITKLQQIINQ